MVQWLKRAPETREVVISSLSLDLFFLRRPKGRRSNIALDLQFMQIFTNQKYS